MQVIGPCCQHRDAAICIRSPPARQNTPGRTRASNHEIEPGITCRERALLEKESYRFPATAAVSST